MLHNPDMLLQLMPSFNGLEWGSFVESFATLGRLFIEDQLDHQCPECICQHDEHDIKFDIEQNFVSQGGVPAWFDWVSPNGNCFLLTTVAKARENAHRHNAGARHPHQPAHMNPATPHFSPTPIMSPTMQSNTVGSPHMQQLQTPQQSNTSGHNNPFQLVMQNQHMPNQFANNQGSNQAVPITPASPPFQPNDPLGLVQQQHMQQHMQQQNPDVPCCTASTSANRITSQR